jgi:trehalose 6-phosphate phosphatase
MAADVTTRLLLATDFDGTIAPIVAAPEDARIDPLAERFLERCTGMPGVVVAIFSGRDVEDVRHRIGGVRAMVAGADGLECVDAGGNLVWTTDGECPELPPSLAREVLRAEIRIEWKKFSVAFHFRGAPAEAGAQVNRITAWADEHNLDVITGRKVLETRVRGGGKRAALRALAMRLRAERVFYAGDDDTDFPALSFAAAHGHAIFVESEERTAPEIAGLWRVARTEDLLYGFARGLVEAVPDAAGLLAPAGIQPPTETLSSASDLRPDRSTAR